MIKVRLQRMFPNCAKYVKCCSESWDSKLESIKDVPKPETLSNQPHINNLKKPDEFDKW